VTVQGTFHKTILRNGIRVVSEGHLNCRAVSLGIWIKLGTRDETSNMAGVSHLLEHLVFKGTKNRTAYEIAKSLEVFGGELNAFTSKEHVCFQALVLNEHWLAAVDVLCDLVDNMQITSQDLEIEKKVVLQEIGMAEENYEEIIYDDFFGEVYKNHPLGNPILGSPGSVFQMKKKDIEKYYRDTYVGSNIVVSAAGNIEHLGLVNEIEKRLNRKPKVGNREKRSRSPWRNFHKSIEKPSEQIHMLLGFPAVSFKNNLRFEFYVLNAFLGGGMTSKLYQAVREKRGLVYTIHSSLNTFTDCGLILIYAQTDLKNVKPVVDIVFREVKNVRKKGISKSDFEMFKTQIVGSVLLGSDDIENRMASLAINEMSFEEYRPVIRVVEDLQKLSFDSVNYCIDKFVNPDKFSGLLLGSEVDKMKNWWEK